MLVILGVVLAIVLISYFINHKLIIRIDTFFRKGFKKIDDTYGVYRLGAVSNGDR